MNLKLEKDSFLPFAFSSLFGGIDQKELLPLQDMLLKKVLLLLERICGFPLPATEQNDVSSVSDLVHLPGSVFFSAANLKEYP
jgi:hypothetical protein